MDNGFGRPQDKDIQRQFMKKIRGDKLQSINAECQLEICLAFKETSVKEPKKSSRKKNNQNQVDETKVRIQQLILMKMDGLGPERQTLIEKFSFYRAEWKFQQIEDNQPLPEYFFDDGCDLSYIIHELQQKDKKNQFSPQQLLFLQFLCLWGRNLMTKSVLDYYKDNMEYLIQGMKNGIEKIKKKLQNYVKNQKLQAINQQNDQKMQDQFDNENNQAKGGSVQQSLNSIQKKLHKKSEKSSVMKHKKIGKQPKKPKGKKKSKKKEQSSQSEEESVKEQEENKNYPADKQLAVKTCNYICWAYWYVIKKQ